MPTVLEEEIAKAESVSVAGGCEGDGVCKGGGEWRFGAGWSDSGRGGDMSLSYARRVLNQQDRPLWPKEPPKPVEPVSPKFEYLEPFTSKEVNGVCLRLNRRLKRHESNRRVRYENGRRIEILLNHEQLKKLSDGVPGRTRRPVDK